MSAVAAKPKGKASASRHAAAASLSDALHEEAKGTLADRRRRLKPACRTSPDYAPAQWQRGRMKIGPQWVEFDDIAINHASDELAKQYLRLRAKTNPDVNGHLKLADWCKRHGMHDRRRAHLTAVLDVAPNHAAVRRALAHVRIGGEWMSRDELAKRRKDAVVARKNLQRWLPKIAAIRTAFLGSNGSRQRAALKQLQTINDPNAADAIELGLGWQNPRLAEAAVAALGRVEHPQTTISLARLAVASPWKAIRSSSAKLLKNRRFDHFVPQLLAITRTKVRSRRLIYARPNGSLHYRHAFYRENRKGRQLAVADHSHHIWVQNRVFTLTQVMDIRPLQDSLPVQQRFEPLRNIRKLAGDEVRVVAADDGLFNKQAEVRAKNDGLQTVNELAQRRQAAQKEENRITGNINRRIRELLTAISGEEFTDDPKEMWDWWETYSEVWTSGVKPFDYRYGRTYSAQAVVNNYANSETRTIAYVPPGGRGSCFAAGTPVWTERGLIAVDKVRIGDKVLSKNVETGQLAYKPVLKTTIRPPVEMMKLEIGTRTVTLTKGHPFWISGYGWMKARDIKKGMRMHDVTGTTAVQPAGAAPAENAYNLIVADFHTYFVGESKVLSHDNTPIAPTAALVPGLARK